MAAYGRKCKMVIRLSLRGCTNRPFYHIVVMHNKQSRDAKAFCQLGVYDPLPNIHGEVVASMDYDKLRHYLSRGVTPNKVVSQLLGLAGYFPIHPTTRLKAFRIHRQEAEREEAERAKKAKKEAEMAAGSAAS